MNIVDVIIILMLLSGAVMGFKRGVLKQTVMTIGGIILLVLAFNLKNPVAEVMFQNLPFFKFGGVFANVTSLNILIYEVIAFFIVSGLLAIILRILVWITSLVEKALDFTIILAIPSKILGAILGAIEAYVIVFFVLYIVSLPVFNIGIVKESKWKENILTKSPILAHYARGTVSTFNEIYSLNEKFKDNPNSNELNRNAIDIMLKNKVVTVKAVEKLVESGKIDVPGIDAVLDKYR